MQSDPQNTTANDICKAALKDSGAYGVGQTPLAEDISDARTRMQWMLQQWERKRWFIYHLVTYECVAQPDPTGQFRGKQAYTVGPGGDFDTDTRPYTDQYDNSFGGATVTSARPNRIESAFLRQLTQSQPNQIDYPLQQIFSREDYNRIALKGLSSFPGYFFYDSAWDLGLLYPWPIPQPDIYSVHITVREQLPPFMDANTVFEIPYEYYNAIVLQLAMRLRPKYGILTMQGDTLPAQAKDALNTLRKGNYQIGRLHVPGDLVRPQLYNIFSDRAY
jgi:hypothetical protein